MEKSTVALVCIVLVLFVAIFAAYSYKANVFGAPSPVPVAAPPTVELGPPAKEGKSLPPPNAGVGEEPKQPGDDDPGVLPPPNGKKPGGVLRPGQRQPVPPQGRRPIFGNRHPSTGGCCPGGAGSSPVYPGSGMYPSGGMNPGSGMYPEG